MAEKFYYVDKQLARLEGADKAALQAQIDDTDWSILQALEHIGGGEGRGVFAPLPAMEIAEIKEREEELRAIGLAAIRAGKVGAVLLAGGQGTRLGYDQPKGTVDIGVTRSLYIFQCLIQNLQKVTAEAGCMVPLYIMTSTVNHEATVSFFQEHDFFGYDSSYVKFFIQEMAPAVDYEGRVLMSDEKNLAISPNGNGGWFGSMVKAGLLSDLSERGIQWLNIFAVDNVLQQIADPVFVGATIDSGCESGAKVVKKAAPDERVGVLCSEDGRPSIVEYYEMTDEMLHSRKENGDLSYGFGVILNYLFGVEKLVEIVEQSLPVHVVEKKVPYMDENGVSHKPQEPNAYKFETLILDMVHMMGSCLPYEVVREKEFAPIKNKEGVDSIVSARELLTRNGVTL